MSYPVAFRHFSFAEVRWFHTHTEKNLPAISYTAEKQIKFSSLKQKAGKTTINLVPFQIYHDKNYSLKNGIRRTVFLNNIDWQNVHLSNNATIYKANCFCLHPTTPLG